MTTQLVPTYVPGINTPETNWGDAASLLPPNETVLDHAQEMTDAERYPLPFGAAIRAKDPYNCDIRLLPFLAWERNVGVWQTEWDNAKKRYVTAIATPMHKMQGTKTGIEQYVNIAGGKVIDIVAPPSLAFPGRSMTDAERAAWLATFQQLRSYEYALPGFSQLTIFLTTQKIVALDGSDNYSGGLPGTPAGPVQTTPTGKFYPVPDQACLPYLDLSPYLGNKTYIYNPDGTNYEIDTYTQETPGADGEVTLYEQAVLPDTMKDALFLNNFTVDAKLQLANPGTSPWLIYNGQAGYFLTALDFMVKRVVTTLSDMADYGSDNLIYTSVPVTPGLAPITIKPELVMQEYPESMGDTVLNTFPLMANGMCFVVNERPGYFLTEDMSRYHLYQLLYLYNPQPGAAPPKMPPDARCFLDNTYIWFPAYTALVRAEIFSTLPRCALNVAFTSGYLVDPDMSLMWDVVESVRAAKSARDLILVDTRTYDIATPDVALLCGAIICGQAVPILNV